MCICGRSVGGSGGDKAPAAACNEAAAQNKAALIRDFKKQLTPTAVIAAGGAGGGDKEWRKPLVTNTHSHTHTSNWADVRHLWSSKQILAVCVCVCA